MTPVQLAAFLIDLACDLRFCLLASLAVGIVCALAGMFRSYRASAWAGGVGAGIALALLEGLNYLLNLPLGEPLPALPQGGLPPDYTQFWLLVGAGFACWEFLKTVATLLLLAGILRELQWIRLGRRS